MSSSNHRYEAHGVRKTTTNISTCSASSSSTFVVFSVTLMPENYFDTTDFRTDPIATLAGWSAQQLCRSIVLHISAENKREKPREDDPSLRKGKCTLNMRVLQTPFAEARLVKTVWQEVSLPQEMYLSWELQQKFTFWLCNMKWNWPTEVRIIAAPSGRGVYGAKATCRLKTSEQQPKPSAQDHHTYWTYWLTQPPLCLTLAKISVFVMSDLFFIIIAVRRIPVTSHLGILGFVTCVMNWRHENQGWRLNDAGARSAPPAWSCPPIPGNDIWK